MDVNLKKKDNSNLTKDNDGHSVEDGSNVGQQVQQQSEFEWVNDILDKEEAAQFSGVSVEVGNGDTSNLLNLFGRQCQVDVQEFPEKFTN